MPTGAAHLLVISQRCIDLMRPSPSYLADWGGPWPHFDYSKSKQLCHTLMLEPTKPLFDGGSKFLIL